MDRYEVLEQARDAVTNRGRYYGDARENFDRIAGLWHAITGVEFEPHQVSAMMIAVKLARLHNEPSHRDSMIDIAGYAALWSECIEQETSDD